MVFECHSPRDVKKAMHVTWSDTDLSDHETSNHVDIKYEQNKYIAFVASVKSHIEFSFDSDFGKDGCVFDNITLEC